jgi:hypothetical protein
MVRGAPFSLGKMGFFVVSGVYRVFGAGLTVIEHRHRRLDRVFHHPLLHA